MITAEEDMTIAAMQYFWRSTSSIEKEGIISTTLSKHLREDWV